MLLELGEFQQLVDRRFYAGDRDDRIVAWGKIGLIRDMSGLVSIEIETRALSAFEVWQQHSAALERGEPAAEQAISQAVGDTRTQVLSDLRSLQ